MTVFKDENQAALRHGGAAARKALSADTEFTEGSPARAAELAIQAELETIGRSAIVARNARRVQAIADLYSQEFFTAAVSGNNARRDGYAKIALWATRLANQAWSEAREEEMAAEIAALAAQRDRLRAALGYKEDGIEWED